VIVEESPGFTLDGLAVQLTVGGSNALTTYEAVQSAFWLGLSPSFFRGNGFDSAGTKGTLNDL
jgi:hypothetical protein